MVIFMNKRLIIFSCLIGVFFALYLFNDYRRNNKSISKEIKIETVYFIQIGAYKKIENVSKVTKMVNYNFVEYSDGIYFIYVAITKKDSVLNKLKEFYSSKGINVYVKEKELNNRDFLEYLDKYDKIIEETNDIELINAIEKDILKNYENFIN